VPNDVQNCPECGAALTGGADQDDVFGEFLGGEDSAATQGGADDFAAFEDAFEEAKSSPPPGRGSDPVAPTLEIEVPAPAGEMDKTMISRPGMNIDIDGIEDFGAPTQIVSDKPVDFEGIEPTVAEQHKSAPAAAAGEDVQFEAFGDDDSAGAAVEAAGESEPSESLEPVAAGAADVGGGVALMAPPRKSSALGMILGVVIGLVVGGGGGAGGLHFLMLQPKVAELDKVVSDLKSEKGDLTQKLSDTEAAKAKADEDGKQVAAELETTKTSLDAADKKAKDATTKLTQANNEKVTLAQSRAAAEAERDVMKFEVEGATLLALSPELLIGADLAPIANPVQATKELADLWADYFARTEAAFSEAIKVSPNRARNYALRAAARQARGVDQAEVLADLQKAIELDANNQDAVVQFVVARVYELSGKSKEAGERLALAAKAAPAAGTNGGAQPPVAIAERRGEILRLVALVQADKARSSGADDVLRLIDRAIALESADATPADKVSLRSRRASLLLERGERLQVGGKAEEAVASFDAAVASATEAAQMAQAAKLKSASEVLATLGRALELLGRVDEAIQVVETASPLAADAAEKVRFAAARARLRAAKATRPSESTPKSSSIRPSRGRAAELAALHAMVFVIQEEAKQPAAAEAKPAQEPKAGDAAPAKAVAAPKAKAAPPSPELEQALRDAETAIQESAGQSADAFYAKGVVLIAMKRPEPAIEALLQGSSLVGNATDTRPDLYVRALADAYRLKGRTPAEEKIAQLEAQVTEFGDVKFKLSTTSATLDETAKKLATTEKKLSETEQSLAETTETLGKERVVLDAEKTQHSFWERRYKGLMTGTTDEDQRESLKLFSRGFTEFFAGSLADSVETMNAAIRLNPRDARYRYLRALAHYRLKNMELAEDDAKEGSALERQDSPRLYDINRALLRIQGAERLWLESFRPKNEN
jgi:hypothetical protein